MAPLVKRRLTPVHYAKHLLNAINFIRQQKQIPNFDRISRYLQKTTELTPRKCKEHLNNAVSDGLIVEYTAVGFKGQRTGLEQEGYRIALPTDIQEVTRWDLSNIKILIYCHTLKKKNSFLLLWYQVLLDFDLSMQCFRTFYSFKSTLGSTENRPTLTIPSQRINSFHFSVLFHSFRLMMVMIGIALSATNQEKFSSAVLASGFITRDAPGKIQVGMNSHVAFV